MEIPGLCHLQIERKPPKNLRGQEPLNRYLNSVNCDILNIKVIATYGIRMFIFKVFLFKAVLLQLARKISKKCVVKL